MTAATKPHATYRLRLRSLDADDCDDIHKLRALLKLMLRRFRFRVIEIVREQTPRP
jgi:hypothetical protein